MLNVTGRVVGDDPGSRQDSGLDWFVGFGKVEWEVGGEVFEPLLRVVEGDAGRGSGGVFCGEDGGVVGEDEVGAIVDARGEGSCSLQLPLLLGVEQKAVSGGEQWDAAACLLHPLLIIIVIVIVAGQGGQ